MSRDSAPLSAAGLYVAANWASRNTAVPDSESEAELLRKWVDLPQPEQNLWKRKAQTNMKAYALQMVSRPQRRGKRGGKAKAMNQTEP